MRIPSGVTDQYVYFVAVDATDLTTRETGLTGFTVYRSRNGGAATAYTTPTTAELSSSNMPGVYSLLLDEDMTIDSGDDSQELCLHITNTGMAPVTRTVELYRREYTPGATLSSSDIAAIKSVTDALPDAGALTSLATAAALATVDTVVDSILVDTAEIGAAGAGLTVLATQSLLSTVAGYLDTEIAAIKAKTDNLPASPAAVGDIPTAGAVADAVWDEAIAGHAGSGSTGEALGAAGASGDPWITALPGSYTAGQAGYIVGTNLDAAVSSISAGSGLDAAGVRAAIGLASANLDDQLDALPTAGENADAVWDEALSGHTTSGTAGKAAIDTDLRGSRTVIRGTVAGSASTTSLPTSAFSPGGASADQFKGRIVIFDNDTTTAALRGEATDITASTNSATPTLTVTALSATPASGDTFSVV